MRAPTFRNPGDHACFSTQIQSAQLVSTHQNHGHEGHLSCTVLSLQFELDCVLNALVSLLQGSFVASMTATLRQMDDYHYAHLISTFGKIRSDVVVSTPHQCVRVCWLRLRRHVATSKHRPLVQCHILELRSSIRFPRKMFFLHNKE